uniref:Uncharacterized protein n=1 Tax=Arundo donax TaxID=35708 RepID=A0A0A9GEK2_ARUDO
MRICSNLYILVTHLHSLPSLEAKIDTHEHNATATGAEGFTTSG